MNIKQVLKWLPIQLLIGIIVMVVIGSFDGVIYAEIISRIVTFSSKSTVSDVITFALWVLTLRGLVFLAMNLAWVLKAQAVKVLNTKLKVNFFEGLFREPSSVTTSEAVSTLTNDYKMIESQYFTLIFEVFTHFVTLVTSIVYMLSIDFLLGIGFVLLSLVAFLPSALFDKKLKKRTVENSKANEDFVTLAKDTVTARDEVKIYRSEKELESYLRRRIDEMETSQYYHTSLSTTISVLSSFLSFFGRFLPVIVGLYLIIKTEIAPQNIIAIFVASDRIDFPLRVISQYTSMIRSTKPLREKVHIVDFQKTEANIAPTIDTLNVSLENVSFAHDKQKVLFEDLNLEIPFKQKLLLTGQSGSGKSTLLKLIQGIFQPQAGKVRYTDGAGADIVDIRQTGSIAIIAQNPVVFRESLRFNLGFNKDGISDKEMLAALELVNLTDELGPNSLDFQLEEGGANLSGGQLQRIEIARALVHNPKLILADEMTSALDLKNSKKIRNALWHLPITIVEVAHHYNQEDLNRQGVKVFDIGDN